MKRSRIPTLLTWLACVLAIAAFMPFSTEAGPKTNWSQWRGPDGNGVSSETNLPGKETEFTPPGAQPGAKGKRKASWLPEGRGIVIEDNITSDSPKGPVTSQVTRKWALSSDGSTLTVDYYFDDQRGSFEAKRVFVKK